MADREAGHAKVSGRCCNGRRCRGFWRSLQLPLRPGCPWRVILEHAQEDVRVDEDHSSIATRELEKFLCFHPHRRAAAHRADGEFDVGCYVNDNGAVCVAA